MLKARIVALCLLALGPAVLLAGGCGGPHVDREGFLAAGKVAVVSIVLPRPADAAQEGNHAVLLASANNALGRVQAGLAVVSGWQVLDAARYRGEKAVRNFGTVSDSDLAVLFPAAEERTRVRDLVLREVTAWKEAFIGADGLPAIPRTAFFPEDGGPQQDPAVRQVLLQQAGKLCGALQADAVAFAHVRFAITHPRENAFIVTDERTDGLLTLTATLVVVDKTGKIIIDMGRRPITERSRSRDLLPVFRGAGRDAVKAANIDLADPKKKVANALNALVDEAVTDLMAALKAELGK